MVGELIAYYRVREHLTEPEMDKLLAALKRNRHGHPDSLAGLIRRGRCVNGGRLAARVATRSGDGIQQLHPVPKRCDAKFLQVLVRQARENRLVYVILAEDRLVLPEASGGSGKPCVHGYELSER
jgi:hypothetical protein